MFLLQDTLIIIVGIGLLIFSYLIGSKKKLYLITGYSKSFKNHNKICKIMGNGLFIIGIVNVATPLLKDSLGTKIWWAYSAIVIITVIYLIRVYIKET